MLFVSYAWKPKLGYQCSGVSQGVANWRKELGSDCVYGEQGKGLDLSFSL